MEKIELRLAERKHTANRKANLLFREIIGKLKEFPGV